MARKSFTSPVLQESFEIEIDGHVFRLVDRLPGKRIVKAVKSVTGGGASPDEMNLEQLGIIDEFFNIAIHSSDLDRWNAFAESDQGPPLEMLFEIVGYIIETLGGMGEAGNA